jgi:hypothetical protein
MARLSLRFQCKGNTVLRLCLPTVGQPLDIPCLPFLQFPIKMITLGPVQAITAPSLSIRRARRHSQAMSPYPSPYGHSDCDQRPSTSPQPVDDHQSSGIPRVRSMIQLPSVDPYNFNASPAEFAYSAATVGHTASMDSMNDSHGWGHRNVRPSTSTSSISAASHTSSSQANTPPVPENYNGETDISRCKYSLFVRL